LGFNAVCRAAGHVLDHYAGIVSHRKKLPPVLDALLRFPAGAVGSPPKRCAVTMATVWRTSAAGYAFRFWFLHMPAPVCVFSHDDLLR